MPSISIDVRRSIRFHKTILCPKGVLLDSDPVTEPLKNAKLNVMLMKPVCDPFCFVTCCIIMLEVGFKRQVNCGREGIHMVSNNTQIGSGSYGMID